MRGRHIHVTRDSQQSYQDELRFLELAFQQSRGELNEETVIYRTRS